MNPEPELTALAAQLPKPRLRRPAVILVMGVSGSGKSTVGKLLATVLGCALQEGDELHSDSNVEKMRGGTPLTDEDRAPWLRSIAAVIDGWLETGSAGVVTCSALKRSYRDLIIGPREGVQLVYIEGTAALIGPRMLTRAGHYMPASLLDSQLATLEVPREEERPIVVSGSGTLLDIAGYILDQLARRDAAG
ncbi:gluconokinase [Muricoccus pecuniae]|uniref:Gluconokinase n=1 Tax=Muricoccus pecuniae TaxID=693023 RepID=A0A840Y3J4_9PROT|nr:gluconokinase [Roseomonas pecuniae]MBB5694736.1 carbohydrate kinase (thermoresistant glucokinase family) [Roseomonas pecuniae]